MSPLILIVDDEPDILSLYRRKLEREGFRVLTVPDGAQAITVASEHHPDLVLMDIKMPVMDGITAEKKMKELPATQNIKIAFLSAFGDPSIAETNEDKEPRTTTFIRKGIGLSELVELIHNLVSSRESAQKV